MLMENKVAHLVLLWKKQQIGQLPQQTDSKNLGEWRLEVNHVSQWTLGRLSYPWLDEIASISELFKPLAQNPQNMHTLGPWVDIGW